MVGEKEEKKTLWYRFTSWVAASWLGRVVKWIADHTGISWALGKMKNLFGGNDASKGGTSTSEGAVPKSPEDNGKVPERKVNGPNPENPQPVKPEMLKEGGQAKFKQYFSCDKDRLLLVVTNEIYQDLKDNYKNKDNEEEFRTIIQCDGENLCITGSYGSLQDVSGGKKAISVTSVKNEKAGEEHIKTELQAMKTKVGLDDNRRFVEITKISPKPFKSGVSSYGPAVPKSPKGGESIPSPENPQPVKPEMLKKGGQANDGNKENPTVTSKPVSLGAGDVQESDSAETLQDEPVGYIEKDTSGLLQLLVHKNYEPPVETSNRNIGRYGINVIIGENVYHIIGGSSPRIMTGEYISFPIYSVRTQDNESVSTARLLEKEAKITRISDTPSKKPEVESPATDGQPNPSFTQTTASAAPSGPSPQ